MPIGGHDYGIGEIVRRSDFDNYLEWERFLGRLYADINGPYYGGEGSLTSVELRPGYIVNYLFASEIIDGPTLDSIIANNGGDPHGYYAGIINSNPVTQKMYTWHKTKEFIIEQVESENASQDQQNWYDRWKASGEPTTKDGMLSPDEYDEWLEAPINNLEPGTATFNDVADALIAAGYDPDMVNAIIYGRWEKNEYGKLVRVPGTGALENRSGQDSVTLEGILSRETGYNWNILDDLAGEASGSNDWFVFTVDTDGDGVDDTVYREYNDGTIQRVYGAEVDENDPQIAGQIRDARRNQKIYDDAINSEGWDELEDWEKNSVLRENGYDDFRGGWFGDGPDDYSEFGLCSDNYTVKADEDGTNCSDFLTEEEKLVRDYGQEAVDKAKEIYNGVKGIIQDKIDEITEIDSIQDIIDYILPELPEECKESTANKPNDWWKDCVNLSVLGKIPGLPIPLPPGTIDVNTTIRDLENAAIEAGKTLEDIFNPTCTGTPEEIEECENRTISDIIGDWASDVWEDIKGSFEEAGDFTIQGLIDSLLANGYNILSGWILTKVEDAATIENPLVFFPLQSCDDPEALDQATPEQQALCKSNVINCEDEGRQGGYIDKTRAECGPPIHGYCDDNATVKDDAEGTNCEEYSVFGFCVDGTKKDDAEGTNCEEYAEFGLCEDGTKKVDELGTNCTEYSEFGFCEDESTKKVDEEGTNCTEYKEPFDCSSVGRKPPEGGEEATSANDCGSCIDTSLEPNNAGVCEEPGISQEEQDCLDKGRVWNDVTETCEDNCKNTQHVVDPETGECGPEEFVNTGPDEETCAGRGKSFVPADEASGTPSSCGDCVEEGWTHNGVGTNCADPNPDPNNCAAQGKTLKEDKSCGPCTQEGFNPVGANGECVAPVKCWDDSTAATEAECPEEPPKVDCAAQNKVQETPYECGGCLPNFELNPDSQECEEPEEDPNNCAAQGKTLNEDKSCGECTEEGWTSEGPGVPCKAPEEVECNAETATSQVNLTETIPFGDPLPDPVTTYEDDGTQCVATTTTYVEGPDISETVCGDGKPPEVEGGECVECPEESQYETASSLAACGNNDGCVDDPQTEKEKIDCLWKNCPGEDGLYPPEHECGNTPPGECQDPDANNIGGPLPCTFDDKCVDNPQTDQEKIDCGWTVCPDGKLVEDENECGSTPPGECQDPKANNQGGPLPCTFDPCPGGAQRDENNDCPEDLCPDGSQRDADGNCPSTGCVDNPQTDQEKIDCGYKRCTPDEPLVPNETVCGSTGGCVDNPQTFMEKVDCGWTVCPDGVTVVEDANECGPSCTNGALDYPDCLVCPGGELPDAETGCGRGGCDDLVYAAENPLECPGVCDSCSCPEYAAANPEECFSSPPPPPPPPPPEGGGGGSGGGNAQLKPLSITGDPELLARQEFPITDYLSGLFTGRG